MQNEDGKYLRLFGALFATFFGFVALLILLFLFMKLVFGFFNYVPALNSVYVLFIVCIPAMLFIPVYLVYFKRTRRHPSGAARIFSYIVFIAALAAWTFFLVTDLMLYFKKGSPIAAHYLSYNMWVLASTVFSIFLVGIVQAFAMPKEAGWMEKHKEDFPQI